MKNQGIKTFASGLILLFIGFSIISPAEEAKPPRPPLTNNITMSGDYALCAMISLVENHIKSMANSLDVLAQTTEAKSCDWEKIKPLLAALKNLDVPSTIFFIRPDSSYFSVEMGLTGQNLKDRDYFPGLMAGEKVKGSLVVSKSTGKKSLVVASPIKNEGKVIGALGASIFLEELSEKVKGEMNFPENVVFFAINKDSETTLNWRPERVFVDPTKQGSESMTKAIKEMLAKDEGMVEYNFQGKQRKVIFRTSTMLDWRFALGIEGSK